MTHTARIYGSSLYDLAAEEQLTDADAGADAGQVRAAVSGRIPSMCSLLSQSPRYPKEERTGLLETAFGTQAERYLVNFLKLLCERGILGGCFRML